MLISLYALGPRSARGDTHSLIDGYTHEEIADAIYWAEGGPKAQYLYGIRSVKYDNAKEARQICLNTVYNTLVRYRYQRCGGIKDDIVCLGKRYAPIGAGNDPKGLNKNWIKNVKWFLKNPRGGK